MLPSHFLRRSAQKEHPRSVDKFEAPLPLRSNHPRLAIRGRQRRDRLPEAVEGDTEKAIEMRDGGRLHLNAFRGAELPFLRGPRRAEAWIDKIHRQIHVPLSVGDSARKTVSAAHPKGERPLRDRER